MAVRVLIVRAAGTNCDVETAYAWRLAGAHPETLHVKRVLEQPILLRSFQVLTLPGGFSYGDDLAAGTILANQLRHFASDELLRFIDDGKLVLGICNGFQVLVKIGLLPDPRRGERLVTLAFNRCGRFEARWVRLRSEATHCRFLPPNTVLELPVAHAEGRVVCRDDTVLRNVIDRGHVCLTYVEKTERVPTARARARRSVSPEPNCGVDRPCAYPANPNGSAADIAGLTDARGQVLGLMPHPERFVDPTQHPLWTRHRENREPDGLLVFKSAVASFEG